MYHGFRNSPRPCAIASLSSSPCPRDDSPLVSKLATRLKSGIPNRNERISRRNPFLPETHYPSGILDSKVYGIHLLQTTNQLNHSLRLFLVLGSLCTSANAALLWMDNFNAPDTNNFDGASLAGRLSGTEAGNTTLRSFGFQQSINNNQLLLPQGGNGVRHSGRLQNFAVAHGERGRLRNPALSRGLRCRCCRRLGVGIPTRPSTALSGRPGSISPAPCSRLFSAGTSFCTDPSAARGDTHRD